MPFVLPADGESIQGILSHQQTSRRPVHLDPEKNSGQTSVIGILKGCLVRCAVIACRKVGRARKSKQICPLLAVSAMEVRIPDWDNLSLTLSPCMLDFIFQETIRLQDIGHAAFASYQVVKTWWGGPTALGRSWIQRS